MLPKAKIFEYCERTSFGAVHFSAHVIPCCSGPNMRKHYDVSEKIKRFYKINCYVHDYLST